MKSSVILAQIIGSPDEVGLTSTPASNTFFIDTVLPTTAVIASVVGFIVVLLAYTIVNFVLISV